jgi:peptide/nickel transport system substrate-binding protein
MLLLCAASACDRDAVEVPSEPEQGGTVRIAIFQPFDFLTPVRHVRWPTDLFLEHITPPLGRLTEVGDIQWLMAHRLVELGPGMQFPLRRARWEDGVPVTADDFVLTYEVMLHPGAPGQGRSRFSLVQDVVAVNDTLLLFQLVNFLSQRRVNALLMPLPRHVLGDKPNPRRLNEWPISKRPISCGPFRVEASSTRELDLVANDSAAFPVPFLDRVEVRQVEAAVAVRGFRDAEFDVLDDIPVEHVEDVNSTRGARVFALVGASYVYMAWNLRDARFGDPAVRRAVARAVDLQRIIRDHTLGQGDPARGPLVPVLGITDTLTIIRHDRRAARRLLERAGWHDRDGDGVRERRGIKLAFHVLTAERSPRHALVAHDIAEDLNDVGMRAVVRSVDAVQLAERLGNGDFEAFIGRWFPRLGLDLESVWHSESTYLYNYGQFADARADSILVRLRYAEPGPERSALLHQFQQHVYAQQPYLFLYQDPRFAAFSRRVQGARPSVVSTFWNLPEWWIPIALQGAKNAP